MRTLYTVIFTALLPLVFFRLWLKGRSLPAYKKRWAERLGRAVKRDTSRPCLWFHTVSVGEFIAAKPLIQHYLSRQTFDIYITTMTPTGSDRVRDTFSNDVFHSYVPYDIPFLVNRFISRCKPGMHICMETELWPNTLHICKQKNIPVVLANGRLSEKSARAYARFPATSHSMLDTISAAAIQNDEDAARFSTLGLPSERQHITGNIKFDLTIDDETIQNAKQLKIRLAPPPEHRSETDTTILIAASTHDGEDDIILDALSLIRKVRAKTRLILVPRHPERFDDVYTLCVSRGFCTERYSQLRDSDKPITDDILLGDTMGDLLTLLGASDVAFIGGSLIDKGGHNYIEAAAWSLPILSGPSQYNFQVIARELSECKALFTVGSADELAEQYLCLYRKDDVSLSGQAGQRVANKNRGALQGLIAVIDDQLQHVPTSVVS